MNTANCAACRMHSVQCTMTWDWYSTGVFKPSSCYKKSSDICSCCLKSTCDLANMFVGDAGANEADASTFQLSMLSFAFHAIAWFLQHPYM